MELEERRHNMNNVELKKERSLMSRLRKRGMNKQLLRKEG
jgi:hypothetical protein